MRGPDGAYYLTGTVSAGNEGSDFQYFVADDIWGPYSRPRVAVPHGGHSLVFQDKEGRFHSLQWASLGMVPFLHELYVEDAGNDVIIMPKWEWEHRRKKGNAQ
jgi:hypothetical protein